MPSSYTAELGVEQQAAGEGLNAWGDPKLNNALMRLSKGIAGYVAIALTGDRTLTTSTSSTTAADFEAYQAMLKFTGTLSSAPTVTIPSKAKQYLVWNATNVAVTMTTGAGATVAVPPTGKVVVFCDASGVYEAGYSGYGLKDYIDQAVLGATGSLPAIVGNTGKVLYCDGASWLPRFVVRADMSDFGNAYTWTTKQTFTGSSSAQAALFNNAAEVVTVSATAATGTINYDIATQSVLYYTSNAAANWTVNLRQSSGTSLDASLSTGQSVTVAFLVTQGGTPYYNNVVQVDGTTSGVTTKWQSVAPTAGIASSINVYQYTIIKTGSATFTVLASMSSFV